VLPVILSLMFLALAQGMPITVPANHPAGGKPLRARGKAKTPGNSEKKLEKRRTEFQSDYSMAQQVEYSGEFESALTRFLELEQQTPGLDGDYRDAGLQAVLRHEAQCLMRLKRFPEAEKIYLKRGEVLKGMKYSVPTDYAHNLAFLSFSRFAKQDFAGADMYLQQGMVEYDKVIQEYVDLKSSPAVLAGPRRLKAIDMGYLGIVYSKEGKSGEALRTLENSYATSTELHAEPAERARVAAAGRDTAFGSFHWIDAIVWELRLSGVNKELKQEKAKAARNAPAPHPEDTAPATPAKD